MTGFQYTRMCTLFKLNVIMLIKKHCCTNLSKLFIVNIPSVVPFLIRGSQPILISKLTTPPTIIGFSIIKPLKMRAMISWNFYESMILLSGYCISRTLNTSIMIDKSMFPPIVLQEYIDFKHFARFYFINCQNMKIK